MSRIHAIRQEGYKLLQDGLIELACVEGNGIRIDVERLEATKEDLQKKMRVLREELQREDVWKIWRRRYGAKANIGSREQLGTILHDEMGFKVEKETETGRPSMDEESLGNIKHPFVKMAVRLLKYDKAFGTFIRGIEREVVDGFLHPAFNLHTVKTYRSSSDRPNFQNFPVRDKEISEMVRSLFIARPGGVIVENDFKGIEVFVSACYHKDPAFIEDITTPGRDMHRDMAAQIYMLKTKDVDKDTHRYGAKNRFVFPQFYGDYYVACARNLWDWIRKGKLKGPDGNSLFDHLERKGIDRLGACDPEEEPEEGTFEAHLKEVESDFWNKRFAVYGQWRKDWYRSYLDKGYFDMLTGFRVYGFFNRNAVVNYPVQGSAFHCLLWSLIRVNRLLVKYRMKSKVVGQIHDSLIADVKTDELKDYLDLVNGVIEDLHKAYKWLIVPLEIECEIAPTNWFHKREVKYKDGQFQHPEHKDKFTDDVDKFLAVLRKPKAKK